MPQPLTPVLIERANAIRVRLQRSGLLEPGEREVVHFADGSYSLYASSDRNLRLYLHFNEEQQPVYTFSTYFLPAHPPAMVDPTDDALATRWHELRRQHRLATDLDFLDQALKAAGFEGTHFLIVRLREQARKEAERQARIDTFEKKHPTKEAQTKALLELLHKTTRAIEGHRGGLVLIDVADGNLEGGFASGCTIGIHGYPGG